MSIATGSENPDSNEVRDTIIQIIASKLDLETKSITVESHLVEDLGADSLDVADIILAIEDRYGIEIDKATPTSSTVGDIINIVQKALHPPTEEA